MVVPGGRAGLRNHGADYGSAWRRCGDALLGDVGYVTSERNGPDVLADERVPFCALVEADLAPPEQWPPDLIRRSPLQTSCSLRPRVMAGLVPAIHVLARCNLVHAWMKPMDEIDCVAVRNSRSGAIPSILAN